MDIGKENPTPVQRPKPAYPERQPAAPEPAREPEQQPAERQPAERQPA